MGSIISRIRLTISTVTAIGAAYHELSVRLGQSPGIPVPNPTTPYWAIPASSIASHGSDVDPPDYADVVIIGSGITGASVARRLLKDENSGLKIVMLEARDACSGATARNGGHITPLLYHDYAELKKVNGIDQARSIIRFRLAHLAELLRVAKEEGLLEDSQAREVQTFDVFFAKEMLELSKKKLAAYLVDIPEETENWEVLEADALEGLQLSDKVVGCITTKAGAIHPYRLVTGILARLIQFKSFELFTHTPCTFISVNQTPFYSVETPRGTIRTRHVIHATNAWVSHLVEPMRRKIIPARGTMTAQRPGLGLSVQDSWMGTRSFVFNPGDSDQRYDYVTQQPTGSKSTLYPPPAGELMFGGGFMQGGIGEAAFFEEMGCVNDAEGNLGVISYLSGALAMYFGKSWGAERPPQPDEDELFDKGRIKHRWTGIIGASADRMPWVGRLPAKVSGRNQPNLEKAEANMSEWILVDDDIPPDDENLDPGPRLAAPGEWVSVGYTGEGMVHAWLCGKALALMVLGEDVSTEQASSGNIARTYLAKDLSKWFPDAFRVTEKRWREANIESLVE
ncbi:FAD dependent oxidoreductase [Mycena floridula]|nr:FAD dependent oxidoreductase [Mycena floridula]